jgi:uncharacterized protein
LPWSPPPSTKACSPRLEALAVERLIDGWVTRLVSRFETSTQQADAALRALEALGKLGLPMLGRRGKLPPDSLERLQHQARLQLEARSGPPRYEMLPVEPGRGLCRLPPPSAGDLFFDIEADRYAIDGTFHYLPGWVEAGAAGEPVYRRRENPFQSGRDALGG